VPDETMADSLFSALGSSPAVAAPAAASLPDVVALDTIATETAIPARTAGAISFAASTTAIDSSAGDKLPLPAFSPAPTGSVLRDALVTASQAVAAAPLTSNVGVTATIAVRPAPTGIRGVLEDLAEETLQQAHPLDLAWIAGIDALASEQAADLPVAWTLAGSRLNSTRFSRRR